MDEQQTKQNTSSTLINSNVERRLVTRRSVWILVVSIVSLGCLNVFLTTVGIPDSANALHPGLASKRKIMQNASIPILIVFPVASFIMAAFLSLIPYKKYNYSEKYLPFALITLLIVQCIVFVLLLSD